MASLIDLSTLGIVERNPNAFNDPERAYGWNDLLKILEASPTVDAAEVVRCKDCAKDGLFTCPICFIENKTLQFVNHSPDFYCGEGERRTDGKAD